MSGHSKWAQIKRQKGTADAKRGTLYTKLSNMISAAVREGGKEPEMNVRLRLLLEKARSANMPNATIDRAIKRGSGELAGGIIEEVLYECFGPGGVACMIAAVTDNKNRTTSEVRHVVTRHGGRLGSSGSVAWMFEPKGKIEIPAANIPEATELALIDGGLEDSVAVDGGRLLYCTVGRLETLKAAAEANHLTVKDPEIVLVPKKESRTSVENEGALVTFLNDLEALADVTNVTTNAA